MSYLISSFVFADGETRKATQKEKDFYRLVMETLIKALPAGPEGWGEEKSQFTELEWSHRTARNIRSV